MRLFHRLASVNNGGLGGRRRAVAVAAVAEEPEEGDGKSRHKEREGSEQAGQWILPDRR